MRKRRLTAVILLLAMWPLAVMMERGLQAADTPLTPQEAQQAQALLDEAQRAANPNTPVGGVLTPQEAQAIIGTRQPAQGALVEAMARADGAMLGCDAQSRTFYCTLGENNGDAWPQVGMLAEGVPGLEVAFVEDYSQDSCREAIRSGRRYELIAYTAEAYERIGVVFTALPVIALHAQETIGQQYVPGWIDVASGYELETVRSAMLVHTRGGGFPMQYPKESYRIELHEVTPGGRDVKRSEPLLGFEADTDFLLLANTGDETRIRNHLCWKLWENWSTSGYALTRLESRMVEVFVNDVYMGLYQMLERVDAREELKRMGANPGTDAVFRVIREENIGKRPISRIGDPINMLFELRYAPENMSETAFEALEGWVTLNLDDETRLDDDAFRRAVRKHIDTQAMMEYYLFMQVTSLGLDNVQNNLFVWAINRQGEWRYYLSPWDMDISFKLVNATSEDVLNLWMVCPTRMLDLNIAGSRGILWDLWRDKRRGILRDDRLRAWIMDEQERINASGAYLRDSERWLGQATELDLTRLADFAVEHMLTIHIFLSELWAD